MEIVSAIVGSLVFAILATIIALVLGIVIAAGATWRYFWYDKKITWQITAGISNWITSAIEVCPSIALLLLTCWIVRDIQYSWLRLLCFTFVGGLAWSASTARLLEDRLIIENQDHFYVSQFMMWGVSTTDIFRRLLFPKILPDLRVSALNTFIYALVVETSLGFLFQFSLELRQVPARFFDPSFGRVLAIMYQDERNVFWISAVVFVLIIAMGLNLSRRLSTPLLPVQSGVHRRIVQNDKMILGMKRLVLDLDSDFSLKVADNLKVNKGSIVWLRGASGSGKSLFIRLLLDRLPRGSRSRGSLLTARSASIESAKHDITDIAEVFLQEPAQYLYPYLSTEELANAVVRQEHLKLDKRLDLDNAKKRPVSQLSAGQKRIAALSIFFGRLSQSRQKSLLILDEPDASLDREGRRQLLTRLRESLESNPCGILYVTHRKEMIVGEQGLAHFQVDGVEVWQADSGFILTSTSDYSKKSINCLNPIPNPSAVKDNLLFDFKKPVGTTPESEIEPTDSRLRPHRYVLLIDNLTVPHIRNVNNVPLVRHVDLFLAVGERVVITGDNGTGKSTLLKAIMGLEPRRVDSFTLHGNDVADDDYQELGAEIGFLFDDNERCFPRLQTLSEIIEMLDENGEARKKFIREANSIGLKAHDLAKRPMELSGGQRQLFAWWVVSKLLDRKIIFADEAFSRVDRSRIKNLASEIASDKERAYIIVSHDEDFVTSIRPTRIVQIDKMDRQLREQDAHLPKKAESNLRPDQNLCAHKL